MKKGFSSKSLFIFSILSADLGRAGLTAGRQKEKGGTNMNFKRVLAMLLALFLAVNMAVPGVSALTAGEGA